MKKIFDKEYYNINEVAEILGVDRVTIYRYRKVGKITATYIGRTPYFTKEDIKTCCGQN